MTVEYFSYTNTDKTLLVGTLKFLNNMTALNERRKMGLWCQLFDTPDPPPAKLSTLSTRSQQQSGQVSSRLSPDDPIQELTAAFANLSGPDRQPISSPFLLFVAKKSIELKKRSDQEGTHMNMQALTQECMYMWKDLPDEDKKVTTVLPASIDVH
jgi:palmitoyltransferase